MPVSTTMAAGVIRVRSAVIASMNLALDAFLRFGKGRHPAALNFGDCLSYALAKATGEPLLFKGEDFAGTGVARAV